MKRTRPLAFRLRRLLAPTFGLRRYAVSVLVGVVLLLSGLVLSFRMLVQPVADAVAGTWYRLVGPFFPAGTQRDTNHLLGGILLALGIALVWRGLVMARRKIHDATEGSGRGGAVELYRRRQILAAGPKVVAIGGGTGLSTLLRGLKQHTSNVTAIVTVSDDGGSSGRLSSELGIMPPGDIRNCLVALADAEKLMTDLFQHRFQGKGSLSGHSIGNLLIAGLIEQCGGDVDKALRMASEVLAIRGRVVPSTTERVRLRALMEDGTEVCGETAIVGSGLRIRRVFMDPERPSPHPAAIEAIQEADLVVIGPGSVYTSVVPNLLVDGIASALEESDAVKAYVCNVMTQRGESDAFTAAEHLVAIQANVEGRVCDHVVVNTGVPSPGALEKYKDYRQDLVVPDLDRLRSMGYRTVTGDFMSETDYVRHDPAKLSGALIDLLYR